LTRCFGAAYHHSVLTAIHQDLGGSVILLEHPFELRGHVGGPRACQTKLSCCVLCRGLCGERRERPGQCEPQDHKPLRTGSSIPVIKPPLITCHRHVCTFPRAERSRVEPIPASVRTDPRIHSSGTIGTIGTASPTNSRGEVRHGSVIMGMATCPPRRKRKGALRASPSCHAQCYSPLFLRGRGRATASFRRGVGGGLGEGRFRPPSRLVPRLRPSQRVG
jgi:hypothetical protein